MTDVKFETKDLTDRELMEPAETATERMFLILPCRLDAEATAGRIALMYYAKALEAMEMKDEARQMNEYLDSVYGTLPDNFRDEELEMADSL